MLPALDEAKLYRQSGSGLHLTLFALTRVLAIGILVMAHIRPAHAMMSITPPIPGTVVQEASASTTYLPSQANRAQIQVASSNSSTDVGKTITITLPVGTRTETLKAVLNGKTVSDRFSTVSCNDAVCETGTLTTTDGLLGEKNLLYVIARKADGSLVSSRLRFAGSHATATVRAPSAKIRLSANAVMAPLPTNSSFLPPSIAFTISPGGWQSGQTWITVGTEQSYPDSNYTCSGRYTAVVLDRVSLTEKTAAPESSPQCIANGAALTKYLKALAPSDLVIVGTNAGQNTDAGTGAGYLDTTSVGGTEYLCNATCTEASISPETPLSYLMVGAGQAAPGSAYENYDTAPAYETFGSFATGMLIEDSNGNYNFHSSSPVEYVVTPNDPNSNNQSTVTLQGTASFSRYKGYNYPNKLVFSPPSNENGYWLLFLRRDDLDFVAGQPANYQTCFSAGNGAKQETDITNCGQFFATGSTDPITARQAYANLVAALQNISFNDLVFLVTVGNAANPAYTDPTNLAEDTTVGSVAHIFATTLESWGGTTGQILSLYAPNSAYTLISCLDCGNSLTGHAVLSTTVASQQWQTGTVHGLLARNLHGLYWPGRTSQETSQQVANKQGADFTLNIVASTPPVEWPELSGNLLPNASSVDGQVAAYQYLSYQLITQHYILGAQGDYLDDIHFYFTGSNNTYIDYHTFDPLTVPFPDPSGSCYSWPDPVTGTTLPCFTPADLAAMATQVKTEIVNLDNVLQFMVNGSTNMKDVVAAGNGSAALALIGAASAVEGSNLQPPPDTPVTQSASAMTSLFSSLINLSLQLASDGLVDEDKLKTITAFGSTVADGLDFANAVTGGVTTGGDAPLPSPDYPVKIGIANLANSGLQEQLTAGFDIELDTILGDWGKLSALGPLITDSNNAAFYAPNQAAQNLAVTALGQAAQRNFYMSLLPISYSVQYYPSWFRGDTNPPNPPDMGTQTGDLDCNSWYPWNQTTVWPLISLYYPTYLGTANPWGSTYSNTSPIDYYVIASQTVNNPGSSGQRINFLDGQVGSTLFSPAGLNIPLEPFVMPHGPMAPVFWDTTVKGFDNFPAHQTLACGQTSGGVGSAPNNPYMTATSLSAPSSSVLGEAVDLVASVTSAAGVPKGTVSFQTGNTVLGTAPLDSTGKAELSANGLVLGTNSITAYYIVNDPYYASQSAPSTIEVYANAPGMLLSLSAANLTVTYGAMSSPVTVQVNSESGLVGAINFSCTGLPVGMTCNFNPAQVTIAAGSSATTSFTISSKATQAAGTLWGRGIGILLLPFSLLCLWRIRNGRRHLQGFACLLLLSVLSLGLVIGCGGGSSKAQQLQETGSKTILVTATSGSITRTIPLVLNIQ